MEIITRYGDVGTPERHNKLCGVAETVVDGQLHGKGIESYLDAFLEFKIFNQEQHNVVYQLIRDYQKAYLWEWRIVHEYCDAHGLSSSDAELEREIARKNYDAALKYNYEFAKLSGLAHLTIGQMGVYISPEWKLKQLADRLIKYYCNHERFTVVSLLST